MKLIIEIGNTNIDWGIFENEEDIQRIDKSKTSTKELELNARIDRILSQIKCNEFEGIVIGSVVPKVTEIIKKVAENYCAKNKIFIPKFNDFNKILKINVKQEIIKPGIDRLANANALFKFYDLPACSIDAGTAITIETVDSNGVFQGGAILPGENLQLKALHDYTAQLGAIKKLPEYKIKIGKTTSEAIACGIKSGITAGIISILKNIEETYQKKLNSIVVTGGDAKKIYTSLSKKFGKILLDDKLAFRGLIGMYYGNK